MTIYKVELTGWDREYYFSTADLAKEFANKYKQFGYNIYNIEAISIREAI